MSQPTPFGPSDNRGADPDPLTSFTYPVTIGSADTLLSTIFFGGYCRRVYPCGNGNLYIKRAGDSAFTLYPVQTGGYIDGKIIAIGGTTTGSNISGVVVEL